MPTTSCFGSKADILSEIALKKICLALFLTEMAQFHEMVFNILEGQRGNVMRHEGQHSTECENRGQGVRTPAFQYSPAICLLRNLTEVGEPQENLTSLDQICKMYQWHEPGSFYHRECKEINQN